MLGSMNQGPLFSYTPPVSQTGGQPATSSPCHGYLCNSSIMGTWHKWTWMHFPCDCIISSEQVGKVWLHHVISISRAHALQSSNNIKHFKVMVKFMLKQTWALAAPSNGATVLPAPYIPCHQAKYPPAGAIHGNLCYSPQLTTYSESI